MDAKLVALMVERLACDAVAGLVDSTDSLQVVMLGFDWAVTRVALMAQKVVVRMDVLSVEVMAAALDI